MDTDDLSTMAYEVIIRAGDVLDCLRSEIGALAANAKTEDEFLDEVRKLLSSIHRSPTAYLDNWNCRDVVSVREFRAGVAALLAHIEKTLATPVSQRGELEFR